MLEALPVECLQYAYQRGYRLSVSSMHIRGATVWVSPVCISEALPFVSSMHIRGATVWVSPVCISEWLPFECLQYAYQRLYLLFPVCMLEALPVECLQYAYQRRYRLSVSSMHIRGDTVWVSPVCISETLHFQPTYSHYYYVSFSRWLAWIRPLSKSMALCFSGDSISRSVRQEFSNTVWTTVVRESHENVKLNQALDTVHSLTNPNPTLSYFINIKSIASSICA
jgi:hypothetical protein